MIMVTLIMSGKRRHAEFRIKPLVHVHVLFMGVSEITIFYIGKVQSVHAKSCYDFHYCNNWYDDCCERFGADNQQTRLIVEDREFSNVEEDFPVSSWLVRIQHPAVIVAVVFMAVCCVLLLSSANAYATASHRIAPERSRLLSCPFLWPL